MKLRSQLNLCSFIEHAFANMPGELLATWKDAEIDSNKAVANLVRDADKDAYLFVRQHGSNIDPERIMDMLYDENYDALFNFLGVILGNEVASEDTAGFYDEILGYGE